MARWRGNTLSNYLTLWYRLMKQYACYRVTVQRFSHRRVRYAAPLELLHVNYWSEISGIVRIVSLSSAFCGENSLINIIQSDIRFWAVIVHFGQRTRICN
jgi:hypothetical protein